MSGTQALLNKLRKFYKNYFKRKKLLEKIFITMLSITRSEAISTLSLSAIKLSESSIKSGIFGGGTGRGTGSISSMGIIGGSNFARFAAELAAFS